MNGPGDQFGRFAVALVGILLSVAVRATFASDSCAPSHPSLAASVVPCSLAQPGSITQALVCTDKSEARRVLDKLGCSFAGAPQILETRDVWRGREALPEGSAARDPVIAAFMAGCLVQAGVGPHPLDPPDSTAEAYLRKSLSDTSDSVAYAAMAGLVNVLTAEDIALIVRNGSSRPALAVPSIALLSTNCGPAAKEGVKSIRAAHAGTPKAIEIDRFLTQSGEICDAKGQPR